MSLPKIDKIAIIGAGPGGLAAAKYLSAENTFSRIVVFEQRSNPGGCWNATPDATIDANFTVPSTAPSTIPESPVPSSRSRAQDGDQHPNKEVRFISPIYNTLDTNIPHNLMRYANVPFPNSVAIFPHHSAVLAYLEEYAKPIIKMIQFSTQVQDVSPLSDGRWSITTRNLLSNHETTEQFDAVVVASGHFNDVFVPEIKGLDEWAAKYPGAVTHSKFYRSPDGYENKKVIVVGNSASGIDVADQVASVSASPLFLSVQTPSKIPPPPSSLILEVSQITEFLPSSRGVRFASGQVENDVDAVIFCTGYLYSFPFLHGLPEPVITDGRRTQNVYLQIFYTPNPTLTFIALPQRIIPFPDSESQSAIIGRVYSGRLQLPSEAEMRQWEQQRVKERGAGKEFHLLPFPEDAQYMNSLHAWATKADKRKGLDNDGNGIMPPWWGDEEWWIRERVPALKAKARTLGAARTKVKTMEELGFSFEEWKREKEMDDKALL